MSNEVTTQSTSTNVPVIAGFFDLEGFELLQRVAKAFASSELVPKQYQGNLANCMIAMDMAQRMRANPLLVMQNLYMVHGQPGWSAKFLIATINSCGRFSSLRYEWKGKPGADDYGCRAWAIERETGQRLDGIFVDWKMVKAEGWSSKNGSKWMTMPDQMFIYRSASFWQRGYAPELGMGLPTAEELHDVTDLEPRQDGVYAVPEAKPAQAAPLSKSEAKAAAAARDTSQATDATPAATTTSASAPEQQDPPKDLPKTQAAAKTTAASTADPATGELPATIATGQVKYLQQKIKAIELPESAVDALLMRVGAASLDTLNLEQFDTVKAELLNMGA